MCAADKLDDGPMSDSRLCVCVRARAHTLHFSRDLKYAFPVATTIKILQPAGLKYCSRLKIKIVNILLGTSVLLK